MVKTLPFNEGGKSSGSDQGIKIPYAAWGRRRQWHPTPVILPGKSHGWRRLVGCSPRGHEESDTTEQLHFHFSLSCIGEGNGNPLQYSCLENPRDGEPSRLPSLGLHSRTRLKRQQQQHAAWGSQKIDKNKKI